jgi:hypothetical protein
MQSVTVEHLPSGHSSAVLPTENGSEDEMRNLEQLLEVGTIILGQALDLLDNSLTSDEQLSIQSQYMPGSTIGTKKTQLGPLVSTLTLVILYKGKHLRHARDHFSLLLDCVSRPRPYVLSYDVRSRNTPMETSREAARTAIENTIAQLKNVVPGISLDAPLTLHAVTPYSQTMQSTFGREVPCHETIKYEYGI